MCVCEGMQGRQVQVCVCECREGGVVCMCVQGEGGAMCGECAGGGRGRRCAFSSHMAWREEVQMGMCGGREGERAVCGCVKGEKCGVSWCRREYVGGDVGYSVVTCQISSGYGCYGNCKWACELVVNYFAQS